MRAGAASPNGFIARSWARHRPGTTKEGAAMYQLAATFTVQGANGWLDLAAVACFFAAVVAAWFVPPHKVVMTLVAAGLCVWALAGLWN